MRKALVALTVAAVFTVLAGCSTSTTGTTVAAATVTGTPVAVPPSAGTVARALGATGFTDCGPAPGGGVTDSGTAYLAGKRIAIDTFPDQAVRDRWEATARGFGVAPFRQAAQWVAYNAVDQNAKRCG